MAFRRWSFSVWYAFACAVGRERNGEATLCFCAATLPSEPGRCYGDDVSFTLSQCADVEACVAILRERCPQRTEEELADAGDVMREFVAAQNSKS